MDKRYQVFVSSTYADLQDERRKVIQVLMEMDCIPAGMELFPATDDEQWEFIKRVIDDCDYYILIMGGRYGSLSSDGISYTEREFDYAVSKGLKVIAFVHGSPDEISVAKSELDPAFRQKLALFREKVCRDRLIKSWTTTAELPGLVALSLQKTIKAYPAVGWIRANQTPSGEVLTQLSAISKENAQLRAAVRQLQANVELYTDNLAKLSDTFEFSLRWTHYYSVRGHERQDNRQEEFTLTWEAIFAALAPHLQEHPHDLIVRGKLGATLYRKTHGNSEQTATLAEDDYLTIRVQLATLGLVNVEYTPTVNNSMGLFWSLTALGERTMARLRTVGKPGTTEATRKTQ